jgi:hypothetical protein
VPLSCQQELHKQEFSNVPTGKNPEDSNLAWSVEAMHWFLLHLSIVMIGVIENVSHSKAKTNDNL